MDGNEAEPVQRLDELTIGRKRQRHDDGVDVQTARVIDQIIDRAADRMPHAMRWQVARLVVVDADHPQAGMACREVAQQALSDGAGADDRHDLAEAAGAVPMLHAPPQHEAAKAHQGERA